MTERVGLEIAVDARGARAEIEKTRASALSLGGSLEKLDRASMLAAKGIGGLGPAMGTLGRSSSEVLRGLGDIAGLIGSGGVFGIAIGAAAIGVTKLVDAFTETERAAKAAADEATKAARAITDAIDASIEDIEIAATKAETGITDTAEARARILRVELSGLNYEIKQLEQTAPQGVISKFFSDSDDKLEVARARAQAMAAELERIDAALANRRSAQLRAPVSGAPEPSGGRRVGGGRAAEERMTSTTGALSEVMLGGGPGEQGALGSVLSSAREKAEQDRMQREREAMEDHQRWMSDLMMEAELARTDFEREQAEKRIAIQRAEQDAKMAQAMVAGQMLGDIASASAGLLAQAMAGQITSLEQFAAEMIRIISGRVGGELIVQGAGKIASGTASMIATGGAVGGNVVAGGIFEAAAGAAILGGGVAAAQALVGGGGARGGGGGARSGGGVGTGERGFGRRSRQQGAGGGDSGPLQIVNVYGVSGPQAEDQARSTVRDLRVARRRRLRL